MENEHPNVPDSNVALDDQSEQGAVLRAITEQIKTCYDPEIPVNIYELGLVYRLDLADDYTLAIQMTLTSPNCPAVGTLPEEVRLKAASVEQVPEATIELVWDPPWEPSRMSEAAKLELGFEDY